MPTTRRALLAGTASLAALATLRAWAAHPRLLPQPGSLLAELQAALGRGRALVVLASTEGCPWCKLVRENYLAPLIGEGQPVLEIDVLGTAALQDFAGAPTTQASFATALRLRVTPTVLFFGRGGTEAAGRLVGVPSTDFYGAYLQERLDAANRAVA